VKEYVGMEIYLLSIFFLALEGVKRSASCPNRFTSGERAPNFWAGG